MRTCRGLKGTSMCRCSLKLPQSCLFFFLSSLKNVPLKQSRVDDTFGFISLNDLSSVHVKLVVWVLSVGNEQ